MSAEYILLLLAFLLIGLGLGFAFSLRERKKNQDQLSAIELDKVQIETELVAVKDNLQKTEQMLTDSQVKLSQSQDQVASTNQSLKEHSVKAEQYANQLSEAKIDLKAMQERLEVQLKEYQNLNQSHTQLKTSLTEREKSYQEQIAQLEENKKILTKEFENIANKIFEEKGKSFSQSSKENLDILLKPFKEQIDGFQKRVNEVHTESVKGQTQLNAEIKRVLDIGLKMSEDASNLTSALKGDSQQRGAWGEAQLERTLEMSGLIQDTHFEKQTSFKDIEGQRKQTDYIIKLPGDKQIIIDSKVSLVAYDKAVSAQNEAEHQSAMAEHIKSVKAHIDGLASKDYTNLIGMQSPSFVLMFMPIEPAYIEALKESKSLFSYGYDKGIVLVSHTTLIPILRTVSNLWMIEQGNQEAREISDKAGEIFNNVCTLAERMMKLGNTLSTASTQYNDTVRALVGQQGLHGKVQRFTQLSSKITKSMPTIEAKHIDFETEKLALAAEPLEEIAQEEIEENG